MRTGLCIPSRHRALNTTALRNQGDVLGKRPGERFIERREPRVVACRKRREVRVGDLAVAGHMIERRIQVRDRIRPEVGLRSLTQRGKELCDRRRALSRPDEIPGDRAFGDWTERDPFNAGGPGGCALVMLVLSDDKRDQRICVEQLSAAHSSSSASATSAALTARPSRMTGRPLTGSVATGTGAPRDAKPRTVRSASVADNG